MVIFYSYVKLPEVIFKEDFPMNEAIQLVGPPNKPSNIEWGLAMGTCDFLKEEFSFRTFSLRYEKS